jgi:hypothetical protein
MRNPIVNQKQYMKPVRIKNELDLGIGGPTTSEMTLHQDIMQEAAFAVRTKDNKDVSKFWIGERLLRKLNAINFGEFETTNGLVREINGWLTNSYLKDDEKDVDWVPNCN